MKNIIISMAIAMFMLTGCAIAGQPKPASKAPTAPKAEVQKPQPPAPANDAMAILETKIRDLDAKLQATPLGKKWAESKKHTDELNKQLLETPEGKELIRLMGLRRAMMGLK